MRKALQLILIIFSFIISFCSADASLYLTKSAPTDTITAPVTIVCLNDNDGENSIVCTNSTPLELGAQKTDKENIESINVFKTSAQYKLLQEILSKNYNKIYIKTTDKISKILRNEICTRAP
jgi:hypothetical protein